MDREAQVVAVLRKQEAYVSANDIAVAMYSAEGIPASLLSAAAKSVLLHVRKVRAVKY